LILNGFYGFLMDITFVFGIATERILEIASPEFGDGGGK
jgi:hypothetical protein